MGVAQACKGGHRVILWKTSHSASEGDITVTAPLTGRFSTVTAVMTSRALDIPAAPSRARHPAPGVLYVLRHLSSMS